MRKLPSLSEMEHITSKEFGEKMDTILDRVTDEDIALIIEHESKSYVICPASWFEFPELKHVELMIKNAVRYVACVDDSDLAETVQMVKEAAPVLSQECISLLLEITKGKHNGKRSSEWLDMKQALEAVLPTTEKKEEKETP